MADESEFAKYFCFITPISARGAGGRGSIPDRVTPNNFFKNERFALLSLALGINELGIRLGDSQSV